ncbi:MAG: N-6 DNA methylase [Candidatus Peribacteraceae bacterium]|nr:N-6 DNA methylase [Candidatus Peribacteraceae bacterium]
MARSTVHYADSETNNILKRLHNKLRPAGTPVERVEYIIELLLLRIFEAKVKQEEPFVPLRKLFGGENYRLLFSHLISLNGEQILSELNKNIFPFYASILSKARTVISGNLPQKMQDQLVLMEEVFANSNFTNNVKGGVIAEVIGLVSEIDEKYILKTDLLGDAIESALSETGGTKDLGLYRTPDHIRRMMVEMVDPDFTDTIFDPACGTAGFLFDAYEHVIEKARKTRQFPAEHIANNFYRTGIGGIEYQGRIRKMAAVNMYIRGLNPHNIDQGDSLKMFDPLRDGGSKSVVIANPPFGAERDQPAYPNVWEEYSKESETTILFVKLMFDLLKPGGRCAVVVSEGFLTWGQNSACALRKLLLSEANLRAVISLPQGVFVSKGGQGAKTSILYFEKGQTTEHIWYYKIENDGFSMGTNRKEIAGGQIEELLELFKEVKQGKKPEDTKHSFCVSKEQIETLDPRIAERIRKEVSNKTKEKNAKKRTKLVEGLKKKLEGKKISKEMYDEKLWQFDNLVEGQIDNEVAKAIEKAHTYHFNLQNYRSNLSEEQIKEWQQTMKGLDPGNSSKIEKRYRELQDANPKDALQILASFDMKDGMQMDIAREYLNRLEKKDNVMGKLNEILKETRQYPFVALSDVLVQRLEKVQINEETLYKQITIKLYGKGITLRQEIYGRDIKADTQYLAHTGNLVMSKIDARSGAFAVVPNDLDGAVVSQDFPVFEMRAERVTPLFLETIVQSEKFYGQIEALVSGATGRRRTDAETFLSLKIPLPSLEVQSEIVEKIERQTMIIKGVEGIEENFKAHLGKLNYGTVLLKDICQNLDGKRIPITEGERIQGDIPYYGASGIIDYVNEYIFEDDLLLVSEDGANLKMRTYPIAFSISGKSWVNNHAHVLKFENRATQKFVEYYLNSIALEEYLTGTTQPKLNQERLNNIQIPFPPFETQREIVEKLDRQMQALEGVRLLKTEAEKRIEEVLEEVWGDTPTS